MIIDQYIDIPKDTWVQIPEKAYGFRFVALKERDGFSYNDMNIRIKCTHDSSVAFDDAPQQLVDWSNSSTSIAFSAYGFGNQFLPYVQWQTISGLFDPDYVRLYYSTYKRSTKVSGISNNGYITIPRDSYTTEPLPSNAVDLIVVVKNNASKDDCRIDIRHTHIKGGEGYTFANLDVNRYNDLTTEDGTQFGSAVISSEYGTLPYLGYQLEVGHEPEWVRVYYRLT